MKIVKNLIKNLNGYKTYIGSGLVILMYVAEQFLGIDIPDYEASIKDIQTAIIAMTVRHAIKK